MANGRSTIWEAELKRVRRQVGRAATGEDGDRSSSGKLSHKEIRRCHIKNLEGVISWRLCMHVPASIRNNRVFRELLHLISAMRIGNV